LLLHKFNATIRKATNGTVVVPFKHEFLRRS